MAVQSDKFIPEAVTAEGTTQSSWPTSTQEILSRVTFKWGFVGWVGAQLPNREKGPSRGDSVSILCTAAEPSTILPGAGTCFRLQLSSSQSQCFWWECPPWHRHTDTPILVWLCPFSHIISLILFLVWKRAECGGGGKIPTLPSFQDRDEDQV